MPNILAQLPASLKETVDIIRKSAFEGQDDIEVASDIKCYINPGEDLITVERGVGVRYLTFKMHVGTPIEDLLELDIVTRSDGSQLRVYRVRNYGTQLQNIILRSQGIV